jgi:hypothetical protein
MSLIVNISNIQKAQTSNEINDLTAIKIAVTQ